MLFIEYPKCSTCKKAKKYLEEHGIEFEDRHIVEENPKKEELEEYRELGLKDKLPEMSEEEQIELLASDGMLVKRPLLIDGEMVLAGFKEAEWPK